MVMTTKRGWSDDCTPTCHGTHSKHLVPPTLQSPLGILDASTLQLLFSSSSAPHPRRKSDSDERPPSSELQRAYGASDGVIPFPSPPPRRRGAAETKRQRRPPLAKLQPMAQDTSARHMASTIQLKPSRTPARLAKAKAVVVIGNNPVEGRTVGARNPVAAHPPPYSPLVSAPENAMLQREIQWIHAHFPVRRLANARCSLALRRQLFADTLRTNLVRAAQRDALARWRWTITKQKELEAARLKCVSRLVACFAHASPRGSCDCLARRWGVWKHYVEECIEDEQLAAAVAIQHWHRHWKHAHSQRVGDAVAIVARMATRFQSVYRMHRARRQFVHCRLALVTIQRFVRRHWRRRLEAEQAATAKSLEQLFAQLQREQKLLAIIGRSRVQQAVKIQRHWRRYLAWRGQLVDQYVADLVDQVEFNAAVCAIQSHIRGYHCRFRLKRKRKSAVRIQAAWRQHFRRITARIERKMLLLRRELAARCLQRTFVRNRERRRHRRIMQQSTRPLYLRALAQSASFRARYTVPIAKSAVAVIQSAWRRHVRYVAWRRRRSGATARILRWYRRVCIRWRWESLLVDLRSQRRHVAAVKIQLWLAACARRSQAARQAQSTQQLARMLTALLTIQRFYRHHRDHWVRVVRMVLREALPGKRAAAIVIQRQWRCSHARRRRCHDAIAQARDLQQLEMQLREQQRVEEETNAAARCIQRGIRRWLDRRNGKLLLKRYKVTFQKELRRKQQRQVIHGYLAEQNVARVHKGERRGGEHKKKKKEEEERRGAKDHNETMESGVRLKADDEAATTLHGNSPMAKQQEEDAAASGDDPDVVRCWSDEFQCHYLYNSRTGESSWC